MTDKTGRFNYLALAIGVVAAMWSATSIDERFAFIRSSVAVQGTVIELTYGAHHPLIEFVTKSGERVSFPGSFVTVEVGDTVPVRYDPARPLTSARVDTFENTWLESIISIVFTITFLYAGLTGQSLRPELEAGRD
ncbi:TPA: DUF3592 domain-containing protein [Burkholderia aenigmatica]|uniref:DUF3592 domain-containing protein n=1 Tax=Burkholderia sp. AU45251 TaxID=3059204 RepID=UPI0026526EFF|nr:DUF3592 domain-containing protein [Burkholderia sp. AU45251]HDR9487988.1 DUF3592 domain-containing protein [Burkholderia aenigmatica]MDN7521064.1 DUF3592 domain-containing protein [Burkholderia sp. AU45251]HDR9519705.1 DUF3592 domain-containing protein [Burkholderia aenigmatica]HDR9596735.1 DUF3592 domain-containing protein [Burkholderia aenigmatica]HDR9604132.1 DUF3592 domain-containing protein [Burkholderia aenigmatica]